MADDRDQKLLAAADAVRSFFEVTNVREGRGWSAAFKAVRANDYMADSFLVELRALLDLIEVAFDPRFGQLPPPQKRGAEVATAPMPASRGAVRPPAGPGPPATDLRGESPRLSDMKTEILADRGRAATKTPVVVKQAVAPPRRTPPPPARPAVRATPGQVAKKVVPPPPPPPRRNQFVDNQSTSISSPPNFAVDEPTGRQFIPPAHEPPKKRR